MPRMAHAAVMSQGAAECAGPRVGNGFVRMVLASATASAVAGGRDTRAVRVAGFASRPVPKEYNPSISGPVVGRCERSRRVLRGMSSVGS